MAIVSVDLLLLMQNLRGSFFAGFQKMPLCARDSSARIGDVVHVGFCRGLMGQSRRNEEGNREQEATASLLP